MVGCRVVYAVALVVAVAVVTGANAAHNDDTDSQDASFADSDVLSDGEPDVSRLSRLSRSQHSYLLRTKKDRAGSYLFRSRKAAEAAMPLPVRYRKEGYLFRTRKSASPLGDVSDKRSGYFFRTRKDDEDASPVMASDSSADDHEEGKRAAGQAGYLFRTRKSPSYLFRT